MTSQVSVPRVSAQLGYSLWAPSYDSQPNPFLVLEQRIVRTLLPELAGLDIADLGCGTGRWLVPLSEASPRSLVGIDASEVMLSRAQQKVGKTVRLVRADCHELPLQSHSVDLAICSFLVSYLADVDRFAAELMRVCRHEARVLISDLHPLTCAQHKWRRGFKAEGGTFELTTRDWSIEYLLHAFARVGFDLEAVLTPHFGKEEEDILERAGKHHVFDAAAHDPVLVIIQLRAQEPRGSRLGEGATGQLRTVTGCRIALDAEQAIATDLQIDRRRITFLGDVCDQSNEFATASATTLDLSGHLVLPGLVNAHDHLEFALFPRLGKGPYSNYLQWADHIYQPESSPVHEHRAVPKGIRLWWGGIRNLLAGVTTVCHHNPIESPMLDDNFPVSVVQDFEWAHSLALGGPALRSQAQNHSDLPFVIHLGEGLDGQSASELEELERIRHIDSRTVIVHGLAIGARGRKLLNSRDAWLVWCPTSNHFLFGNTHCASDLLQLKNVAIGSDSSLTAAGDLLDEIRFAHNDVGIAPAQLYAQATTHGAHALRLKAGQGTIKPGLQADFMAIRDRSKAPADSLVELSHSDIELVVHNGVVRLASAPMMERLPERLRAGLLPLEVDNTVRWVRAPLGMLFAKAEKSLGCELKLCGRRLRHVPSAWL